MDPLAHQSRYICSHCVSTLRRTSLATRVHARNTTPSTRSTHDRTQSRTASTAPKLASPSASTFAAKSTGKKWVAKSPTTAAAAAAAAKTNNNKSFWENDWTVFSADNAALIKKAQGFGDKVLQSKGVPDDATVMEAMKVIEFAALQLTRPPSQEPTSLREQLDKEKEKAGIPAQTMAEQELPAGLLSLDRSKEAEPAHPISISISTYVLSNLAYKIVTSPPVYVTPEVLKSYVTIQSLLKRPQTFPEIFDLYSSKPVPSPNTNPIKYSTPNPNSHKQAIPREAADAALAAAIEKKDLELAVSIIESSYATKAFQRHKFITKAFPAIGGIALTPAAAGVIASQLPSFFPIANPSELITFATVGMVTYVVGISTLGFVVITTTNDHMERVTWAPGIPLRERWMREEERAAVDKVAISWGFKGGRRGEEQGAEWEALREWCGLGGMILDKTELMDGME